MAASSSVRNTSGCFSHAGHSSEMKMAMPSAMGVAMANDGIPRVGSPEIEAEFLDGEERLAGQLEADGEDNENEHQAKEPGAHPEPKVFFHVSRGVLAL